jgi:Uma2 family endonuclease
MVSMPSAPLTEDEYLRLEREAETRSEFHDGQMFAMAGGSPNHSFLSNRIGGLLDRQIATGCRVFNADPRIGATAAGLYTGDQKAVVTNPMLIVEVLSPSTEG